MCLDTICSLLLASMLAATTSAACERTVLNDLTGEYLGAQSNGIPADLGSTSGNFTYTEQFQPANISTGIISKPLNIEQHRSILDQDSCTTYTELIVIDPSPYVIGTRMEIDGLNITEIDSLITQAGDWLFNATGYAYYNSLETWDPIPEDQQDSPDAIQAAGDAYLDLFANPNATVPWGTACARLDGGNYYSGARDMTTNTCNLCVPTNVQATDRRYSIDVQIGSVNIFFQFQGRDASKPVPGSHTFRVENGKIRYIHTLSTRSVGSECNSSRGNS